MCHVNENENGVLIHLMSNIFLAIIKICCRFYSDDFGYSR